jgi:hypothetical protein
VILLITVNRQTLFQEGNPIPVLIGVLKVNLSDENPVEISSADSTKYIVKKDNLDSKYGLISQSLDDYIDIMHKEDWIFKEQMGSGLVFTRDNQKQTVVTRLFTRYYIIIENTNP